MIKGSNTASQPIAASKTLSVSDIRSGIRRLKLRIADLDAYDPMVMTEKHPPELQVLEQSIDRTLEQTFGHMTPDYKRYCDAARLLYHEMFYVSGQPETPLSAYRKRTAENMREAKALLEGAVRVLEEDLAELSDDKTAAAAISTAPDPASPPSRKVFIVHGHDEAAREKVARFLERVGVKPVILHEQANRGRTIIEKIEVFSDVQFAVVLLTPDDEGNKKGDTPEPRARQNVLLELGYFIGKLGRPNVCALMSGAVSIPTDFAGVVWTKMDDSTGWKIELARELEAAGITIDWNRAMRLEK